MTAMCRCPACSSDKVYSLLDTLHCKRCKHIWKEDPAGACGPAPPVITPRLTIKVRSESLETRMEKRLEEYLSRGRGMFSTDSIRPDSGELSQAVFRSYVKKCVVCRNLTETKDRTGKTWYSRPE